MRADFGRATVEAFAVGIMSGALKGALEMKAIRLPPDATPHEVHLVDQLHAGYFEIVRRACAGLAILL